MSIIQARNETSVTHNQTTESSRETAREEVGEEEDIHVRYTDMGVIHNAATYDGVFWPFVSQVRVVGRCHHRQFKVVV